MAKPSRLAIGVMTGTSLDGLDAALVRVHGIGLDLRVELEDETSRELGPLAKPLRRLAGQQPMTAGEIATLSRAFALLHVEACRELAEGRRIDLVSVHGQTVFHAPPVSWQLLDPAPIAHALGVPVVCDLRGADLAAGGQGAPITPLADLILFRHPRESRAVINLGGFCNLTRLPAGHDVTQVRGGDVCACNQVLDALARELFDAAFDRDGAHAGSGSVDRRAFTALATRLTAQARAGRSLGTGDELAQWIARFGTVPPADLARSACAAIAATVARAAQPAERLVVAGGGTRNRALMGELRDRAGVPVVLSDEYGVPAGLREAMAMAVLGVLSRDRVPITLPAVTGVERAPIAGSWTGIATHADR